MRGDPMTLPDRIERTLVLPVPRQRVWDAITKPEHLAHWLGMVSDMDFRVGGAIHFIWGIEAQWDQRLASLRSYLLDEPRHHPPGKKMCGESCSPCGVSAERLWRSIR